ncbi:hypothetical protein CEXT_630571 [Caerostris extrusa]|uniref:Uncharacterized protein n=1 Tax=Caerostris extrusa TaxID=172846 RepID=A0AAV4SCZ3_CAEEX|nr:hypothetical protein CEXT_630571 [Caerostris extrusa]
MHRAPGLDAVDLMVCCRLITPFLMAGKGFVCVLYRPISETSEMVCSRVRGMIIDACFCGEMRSGKSLIHGCAPRINCKQNPNICEFFHYNKQTRSPSKNLCLYANLHLHSLQMARPVDFPFHLANRDEEKGFISIEREDEMLAPGFH